VNVGEAGGSSHQEKNGANHPEARQQADGGEAESEKGADDENEDAAAVRLPDSR